MNWIAATERTGATVPESGVDSTAAHKTSWPAVSRLNSLLWFQRLRSGLYAFFFAPLAFLAMGLGVISLEFESAVGQPLSSSEGFVSMVIAACVLCTITINDDSSVIGMLVTLAWSVVIGVVQFFGFAGVRTGLISGVDVNDSAAIMQWGLYPIAVIALTGGATLATYQVQRRARVLPVQTPLLDPTSTTTPIPQHTSVPEDAPCPYRALAAATSTKRSRLKHESVRNMVVVSSLVLTCIADVFYVLAAPNNTLNVAAHGLKGLLPHTHAATIVLALLAAIALALAVYTSAFSSVGPIFSAALMMVVPWYFIYPMWASLTGNVATPGKSISTSFALASPVITALGLMLAAFSFTVFMTRRNLQLRQAQGKSQN